MGEAKRRKLSGNCPNILAKKSEKTGRNESRLGHPAADMDVMARAVVDGLVAGQGMRVPTSHGFDRCLALMDAILAEAGHRGVELHPCDILPVIRPVNESSRIYCIALPPWAKDHDDALRRARVIIVSENSHVLRGIDPNGGFVLERLDNGEPQFSTEDLYHKPQNGLTP